MKLFSKHYGTERFFIMIFACILAIVSIFIYAGKINADRNKHTLASTALYTHDYKWSRTSATGNVVSLITNKEKTKVFMLIKNNGYTSFDAREYEVFMTGAEGKLDINPSLTIYSYGTSGYVGFYFTDARGFKNEILKLIIRNDSEASKAANENNFDPNMVRDTSFREHNQVQILANFGASGIKVSTTFDSGNVNQIKLFVETAGTLSDGTDVTAEFNKACADANAALAAMNDAKLNYKGAAGNLRDMGVIVPDVPYYIAEDTVNTVPNDFTREPAKFNSDMIDENAGSSGTDFMGGSENNTTSEIKDETSNNTSGITGATYTGADGAIYNYNYFHSDYLLPGTVHIDWQGKILSDGFITQTSFYKDMKEPDIRKAYDEYLEWRTEMKKEYDSAMPNSIKYDSWRYQDGTYVDMSNADMSNISNIINSYTNALSNYMNLKTQYFDCIHRILSLEAKVQLLGQNTTVFVDSADRHTLWLY